MADVEKLRRQADRRRRREAQGLFAGDEGPRSATLRPVDDLCLIGHNGLRECPESALAAPRLTCPNGQPKGHPTLPDFA
jgi:hypothetical protein